MLDAVAPGHVFSLPTPDQFLAALKAADGGAGVLAIIKNYTGDLMNFELAAELAAEDGLEVATVVVADDVAVENSTHSIGRRGVAGTFLVEKIAGAAAARGDDLAAVTAIAQRTADNVRSMGVALAPCTVPQVGRPSFDLADDEIEIGIGIHGEPGRARVPMTTASDITARLMQPVLDDMALADGERVLLLVNGMGATPLGELYIVYAAARKILASHNIDVVRSLVGDFVTSLEMAGASVTILRMDDDLVDLWDSKLSTIAMTN
jgi:dihydroxyacetone kinase-like protein